MSLRAYALSSRVALAGGQRVLEETVAEADGAQSAQKAAVSVRDAYFAEDRLGEA